MIFYTDGSAHPNPGPGGFGVVILEKDGSVKTYAEHFDNTTNNAMEMRAIIWATLYAFYHKEPALIYSDSAYAINTFNSWMYSWAKNDWTKSDGKTPENLKLVQAFYVLRKSVDVDLVKVNGHAGVKYNELADKLATSI